MAIEEIHNVLRIFLVISGSAVLCAMVCHLLRLPTIVGFIGAGILVGPFGLGLIETLPGANFVVELGIAFLMFSIGIECSADLIKKNQKSFFILGVFQVVGTVAAVAYCGSVFGFHWTKSLMFGFIVSLSSTAIAMKLLQDSREFASPHGTCATGILLFQDLVVIFMTLAVSFLNTDVDFVSRMFDFEAVSNWGLKLIAVGAGLILCRKFIIPRLLDRVLMTNSRELFILAILFMCFGVAYVVENIGMSLGMGAFIAGLLISGSSYGLRATAEVIPLKDIFLGLFFTSVGMLIDIKFILANGWLILGLTLAVIVLKAGIVTIICKLSAVPFKTGILAGMTVFQIGEFSLVLANLGFAKGILSQTDVQYVFSVSALTMILTPFLFGLAPKIVLGRNRKEIISNLGDSIKADIHIIGYGEAGKLVADSLKKHNKPYIILEQNYSLVREAAKAGENIVLCDATNLDDLKHLGVPSTKLAVVCVSGVTATKIIAEKIRSLNSEAELLVRVQYTRQARELTESIKAEQIIDSEYISAVALKDRVEQTLGV